MLCKFELDKHKIQSGDRMKFEEYINLMKRQIKTQDSRERAYQDNIIRPFLKSVFSEFDIEPVDIKIKTEIHQYEQYCGTYEKTYKDKTTNKEIIKNVSATPDLCITSEWHWNNREVEVDYKGVVEIKSPILDNITGFEPKKYKCLPEIERHLNATKNKKVILTDGVTWTFYNKENGITPVRETICLGKLKYRYTVSKNNKQVLERTNGGKPIIDDIEFSKEEAIFNELKKALREFIGY